MANYTQQCRACHRNIEGTGEDICYACLQRERDVAEKSLEYVEYQVRRFQLQNKNAVMLLRRVMNACANKPITDGLRNVAADWIKREGLEGSVLREQALATADGKCPTCGATSPRENAFCSNGYHFVQPSGKPEADGNDA